MEKDLQRQQSHLWEFYKTWVNNHSPQGDSKESEMYQFYEQLCILLNTGNSPALNKNSEMKLEAKDFSAAIHFIVDVISPEKIFCLSHQTSADGKNQADLILVIPDVYSRTFDEIEHLFDFICLKFHDLSCALFKSSLFHRMITEGHVYFSLACNPESLVYDDGRTELPPLRLDKRPEKIERTKQDFYSGLAKAKTFYKTAEAHLNTNLIMAAFMLHQATELCLRALSKSLTNQDKTTHSLKTLLRFSLRITPKLAQLMDDGTAEDERLLILLEGAYLGYRYSEKYSIEAKDLNVIFNKITNLLSQTEAAFLNWMDSYEHLIDIQTYPLLNSTYASN